MTNFTASQIGYTPELQLNPKTTDFSVGVIVDGNELDEKIKASRSQFQYTFNVLFLLPSMIAAGSLCIVGIW